MSSGSAKKCSIPTKMKATVQNLKEIVNYSEQEIYAMLKECNMDPNETVHRLLTQDTFHEVKNKREKKKEIKGMGESCSQKVSSSSYGRGVMGGADHTERSADSNDCKVTCGKPIQTKENGAQNSDMFPVFSFERTANNSSAWTVTPSSYNDDLGSMTNFPVLSENTYVPSPSSTLQHNLGGGQLSLADIVKMGRQRKPSSSPLVATEASNSSAHKVASNTSHVRAGGISTTDIPSGDNNEIHSKQDNVFLATEISHEPSIIVSHDEPIEEWTLADRSAEETPVLVSGASSIYHDPGLSSSLHIDEVSSYLSLHVDDIQKAGQVSGENLLTEPTVSDGQPRADSSGSSSCLDEESYRNSGSFQRHAAEDVHEELSSTTADLQNLSLHMEEQGATPTEENPAVIIPDHLQITNTDCSHLNFGSLNWGVGTSLHTSKPANSNLEVPVTENAPSMDYSDTRHSEDYDSEQLMTSDDSASPITGTSSGNYDIASTSPPDFSNDDPYISERPRQHDIPSGNSFAFSDTIQPDAAAYNRAQENFQMRNIASISSLPESHTDSAPSNLLGGKAPSLQEPDLPIPHLPENQSMHTKYEHSMSSFSGPAPSMPVVLKSRHLSNFHQFVHQNASSATISGGSALPPHLNLPAYSQPTLPQGHLTNNFSYPVRPESIAYMPFSGGSAIHQSPSFLQSAGMNYAIPQFKSSMHLQGLHQSLPAGSGYGGSGGSTNIPRSFLESPSNIAVGPSIGYGEALRSRYKELVHLNQGDTNWLSRTPPPVPGRNFYGIQGPSQQVHPHSQQHTHMGTMGYPNLYHSQAGGISRGRQQQRQSHGSLSGSPGQPSQQPPWHHHY